jgi:hypothetical protein
MIEGGCRCGAVRYTLALDALPPVYACHCHICQRASGTAFSLQALVAETALRVSGPLLVKEVTTEDRISVQRFCATCYARIYNTNSRRPGIAVVRAGTLDGSEALQCVAHIFTAYRQRWVELSADVPSWPEAPPPAAFIAALAR